MTYTLYGIPNCGTVKKAKTWLTENGIEFTFHNFKKDGLDPSKIKAWLSQELPEVLVNNRGTTFRKLEERQKENFKDKEMAFEIMRENSSVIKRPVLEKDEKVIAVGFKPEMYSDLFA
ncbi:MAG: arsenate reductase [Arcticibacterium sp.]|jgi:arsenate reductase